MKAVLFHAIGAKAGTLSIIGGRSAGGGNLPHPSGDELGDEQEPDGDRGCRHRTYLPRLVAPVRPGAIDAVSILSRMEPMMAAIEACEAFDRCAPGWIRVKPEPKAA